MSSKVVGSIGIRVVPSGFDEFRAKVKALIKELSTEEANVAVDADTTKARAKANGLASELGKLDANVKVDAETLGASQQVKAFVAAASTERIGVTVGAKADTAAAKIEALRERINSLGERVKVSLQTTDAYRRIALLHKAITGKDATIDADADTAAAEAKLDFAARDRMSTINQKIENDNSSAWFLGNYSQRLAVISGLVTAIIPQAANLGAMLAAVGTAAAAITPAAITALGAQIGVAAIAWTGLSDSSSKAAQKVNTAIAGMKSQFQGFKTQIQDVYFGEFADQLAPVANNLIPQIREGLTGVAAAMGVVTSGVVQGISAATAGGGFQTMLSNIAVATQALAPGIQAVVAGITNLGIAGSSALIPLSTYISDIGVKFGNWLTQVSNSGVLTQVFDAAVVSLQQIFTLIGGAGQVVGNLFKAFTEGGVTLAPTIALMQSLVDLTSGALVPSLQALGGLMDTVFTSLGPILNSVFGTFGPLIATVLAGLDSLVSQLTGPLIGAVNSLAGPVQTFINALLPLGNVFTTLLTTALSILGPLLGSIITGLSPLLPMLAQIGTAVNSVLVAVAPALQQLVEQAIPPLVGLIGAILPIVQQVMAAVTPLVTSLLPVITSVITMLVPLITQVVTAITPIVTAILPPLSTMLMALVPVIQTVITAVASILAALMPVVNVLMAVLMPVINALLPVVTIVFQGIATIIQGVMNIVAGIITAVLGLISGNWNAVFGGISTFTQGIWQVISGVIETAVGLIASIISAVAGTIVGIWNGLWTVVGNAVSGAMSFMKDAISTGLNNVIGFFRDVPGNILNALGNVGDLLVNAGRSIIDGFLRGLKAAWDAVTGFIGGIAGWIADNKGPIEYDAKLLIPHGKAIMGGFGKSLKKSFTASVVPVVTGVGPELQRLVDANITGSLSGNASGLVGTQVSIQQDIYPTETDPYVLGDRLGIATAQSVANLGLGAQYV